MESQSEIKKLDEYYDYVEEYISLASSVEEARKALLKELKYSSVYYSVQSEDVKKVAHAYRIYGKKLKNMEKIVLEKVCDLEKTFKSPVCNNSPDNHAAALHVSQKSPCDLSLQEQETSSVGDQMHECHEFTNKSKQEREKRTDSPEKTTPINSTEEINCHNEEKNICVTTEDSKNLVETDALKNENSDINVDESVVENSTSMKSTTDSVVGYSNEVDFLLEKAYDNRRIKTKSNFKRKLETLLNAKGKKTCHISPESDKSIELIPNNDPLSSSPMETLDPASLMTKNLDSEVNSEAARELVTATEKSNEALEIAQQLVTVTEKSSEASKTSSYGHMEPKPNSETDDVNQSANLDDVNKDKTDYQSMQTEGEKQQRPSLLQTLSEVVTSGKTASTAYNKLPEIPTELLKNILHKNKMNMTHSTLDKLESECSSRVPNNLITSTEAPVSNLSKPVNITDETKNVINCNVSKSNTSENKSCSNDCLKVPCLSDEILPSDSDKNLTSGSSTSTHFEKDPIKEGTSACEDKKLGATKKADSLEKPSLIETLQNVLKFISENEASKNQAVKDNISHNPPTLIPLENTLKLYQYMMQYYGQSSDVQKRLSNELAKTDILNIQTNSVPEHSAQLQCKTAYESNCVNAPICSSKQDNLEIMDMEVDSGEENADC